MARQRVIALTITALLSAPAYATSPLFRDVTATHVPQAPDLHALDAAFTDVDSDGDLDVVVAVEGRPNRLYLNDGTGRLTWRQGAFGDAAYDSEHVRIADFNGDGIPDVIFVAEDDHNHQFFLGTGGGNFRSVTERLPARSEGNGLAVGDVDGDGHPDVVVGNSGGHGQNFLWLNNPARPGHFIDATVSHLPQVNDDTQGIALADLDGDGDLDMVVGSETPPNRLLINDSRGHFAEQSERLDLPVPLETRQVLVFDATGDQHPDLVFCNLTSNNRGWDKDPQARLLVNDGHGRFRDETAARMPLNTFSTYACAHLDFDGDGDQDLILSAIGIPGFKPMQLRAYANDGSGRFSDITAQAMPPESVGRSWGIAVGDLNGDGVQDLFIGGWGTQARLLLGLRRTTNR
jgi:FG-GAP-like repeat